MSSAMTRTMRSLVKFFLTGTAPGTKGVGGLASGGGDHDIHAHAQFPPQRRFDTVARRVGKPSGGATLRAALGDTCKVVGTTLGKKPSTKPICSGIVGATGFRAHSRNLDDDPIPPVLGSQAHVIDFFAND